MSLVSTTQSHAAAAVLLYYIMWDTRILQLTSYIAICMVIVLCQLICLFLNLPACLSICLSICLSVCCLSIYHSLSELEQTRNELLVQLYQSSEQFVDKNTVSLTTPLVFLLSFLPLFKSFFSCFSQALHRYFEPLNGLSVSPTYKPCVCL